MSQPSTAGVLSSQVCVAPWNRSRLRLCYLPQRRGPTYAPSAFRPSSLAMLAAMRRASSRESDVPTFTRLRVFCAWASSSAAG